MSFVVAQITDTHLALTKPFFRDNFAVAAAATRKADLRDFMLGVLISKRRGGTT